MTEKLRAAAQQALEALLSTSQNNPRTTAAITALRTALAEQPAEPVGQLQEEAFGRGQVMWFNKPADGTKLYTAPQPKAEQQEQEADWEKLYRLEVKKKEALAAKYERDIGKQLERVVPKAEQPAEQVLVAYVCASSHVTADGSMEDGPDYLEWADEASDYEKRVGTPLYTSPQPAKRVPLTDDEIYECERLAAIRYQHHKHSIRGQQLTPADDLQWHFARAIERAHGIGDNT